MYNWHINAIYFKIYHYKILFNFIKKCIQTKIRFIPATENVLKYLILHLLTRIKEVVKNTIIFLQPLLSKGKNSSILKHSIAFKNINSLSCNFSEEIKVIRILPCLYRADKTFNTVWLTLHRTQFTVKILLSVCKDSINSLKNSCANFFHCKGRISISSIPFDLFSHTRGNYGAQRV